MNEWFVRLTEQVTLAPDDVTVKEVLGDLAVEAGFDSYAYMYFFADNQRTISNYRPEWQQLYFQKSYAEIDPIIRRAWRRMEGFAWSNDDTQKSSKNVRIFFSEAADFGIQSGISIPVRAGFSRVAMLTFASKKPDFAHLRTFSPVLAAAAVGQVHSHLRMLQVRPTNQTHVRLKATERTYLRWSSEGKSMRDIAVIENDTYGNVVFHLRNARFALGAITLQQAIALGKELRVI